MLITQLCAVTSTNYVSGRDLLLYLYGKAAGNLYFIDHCDTLPLRNSFLAIVRRSGEHIERAYFGPQ